MEVKLSHKFEDIISLENLLVAWQGFLIGKKQRVDVQEFNRNLIDNLLQLHNDLSSKKYQHGGYHAFNISDPKPRRIHKATVRDRIVHHLIYKNLSGFFDKRFIFDSYSCRENKGAHRAMNRFKLFAEIVSKNHSRTCYVLKGDIRKFFASIDQGILLKILGQKIIDKDIMWLIEKVLISFNSGQIGVGLPLGNLTSQLFSNIYLNEFDKFIKYDLQIKYYIRYADDFVILSNRKYDLENIIPLLKDFLEFKLRLQLHPQKLFIKTFASGVDFLGWTQFSHHRQIRNTTKRRMIKKLDGSPKEATVNSYRGLLSHGDSYKVGRELGLVV